jgi:nucleotide-binding universal stress UspA family protein
MGAIEKLFYNVLCPVDFDANSPAAVHYAGRLALENGGRIYLLHVVPWTVATVPIDASEVLAELKQSATERLRRLAKEKLDARVAADFVVTVATDAGAEVVRVAKELKADVIVMATHGRRGLSHLVLGSVAERVVRQAPCPVLTLRPQA